jgi:hypothetical protein
VLSAKRHLTERVTYRTRQWLVDDPDHGPVLAVTPIISTCRADSPR